MNIPNSLAALLVATLLFVPSARAGDGHDHGGEGPAAVGPALPRFSAVSETFELVGVVDGRQITLYLDRFADNSPVRDARIELEIGAMKFKAGSQGDDVYGIVLPEALQPGVLPVTVTVSAGAEVDLLAGELDIHEEAHAEAAASRPFWKGYAAWTAAGIAVLLLLAAGARRRMDGRAMRAGGAA